ncbi:hypothetical protein BGZ65_007671, partial [Modicella reniformis]
AAFARQEYEEPQGEIETTIAHIWAELLHLDRVSRNDNFFALGGHSLLAVHLIERLRRVGLSLPVSALFKTPTLSVLAESLSELQEQMIPSNLITPDTTAISPEMLPLVSLTQSEIDHIVNQVSGVANIQDIYSLSPLQEGILFHHLLETKGDPYLLISYTAFNTRELLDRYMDASQQVVNRHDVFRTAFVWESLSTPVQVVWRQAPISITELHFDPTDGHIQDQLMRRLDSRQHRIDLSQAPLLRFTIAQDSDGRWLLAELFHHLIGDVSTQNAKNMEIIEFMKGRGNMLPAPQPFRNMIAQARLSRDHEDHEKFFTEILGDIDAPSLPFGLTNVHGQGDDVTTAYLPLPQELNDRLRRQAKHLGVSLASLCHLAWAQVVSRTSGEDRVVFGTVLFGRMQSGPGADSAMGVFVNTLPLRVDLNCNVHKSVHRTHEQLASLLEHEHASLVLAQRCSNVPHGTPLFSSILNYRHNAPSSDFASVNSGIEYLHVQERTNYPLTLSVEDYGTEVGLTVDVVQPLDSERICGYMQQALYSLTEALDHTPDLHSRQLETLPSEERQLLLHTWNSLTMSYPEHQTIHGLFEEQVKHTPQATALVYMDQSMTYTELNIRSNRLAHHLIELGVQPDMRVAICVERSFAMIIGVLAILKAGGAYVPLDPSYASERLRDILMDAAPSVVVADKSGRAALGEATLTAVVVVDLNAIMDAEHGWQSSTGLGNLIFNPQVFGLTPRHLAYIIYTSGSTGKPKGVMLEHRGVVNIAMTQTKFYDIQQNSRVLQFASLSFDASVQEIVLPLSCGGALYLPLDSIRLDRDKLWEYMAKHSMTHAAFTPAFLQDGKNLPVLNTPLTLILGGESLSPALAQNLVAQGYTVVNDYGPTEITVSTTAWRCPLDFKGDIVPIGRPYIHSRVYLLDMHGQPVPLGAVGEMYVGGFGVARGYLNKPEMTAERFLPDLFSNQKDARMFKTGDLARYLPDGKVVFLGRKDDQVKIRG